MVTHLAAAARVAGLTYRLLSTTTMIGFLVVGLVQIARENRRRKARGG